MKKLFYFCLMMLGGWSTLSAQTYTPVDDPDITFECPADIQVTTLPGATTAVANFTTPTAQTNCNPGGSGLPYCSSLPNHLSGFSFMGEYNGSKYFLSHYATDWNTANAEAAANGGHLVAIENYQENSYVRSQLGFFTNSVWIGYNTVGTPGVFNWSNGATDTYTNWSYGEPNSNGVDQGVRMKRYDGRWTDRPVSTHYRYVIEIACQDVDIHGYDFLGEYNGSLYYESHYQTSYTNAQYYATGLGGNLVTINDAAENDFVRQAISPYASSVWIGLTNNNNGNNFEWESGEPVGYTNWRAGEPNEYNYYVGTRLLTYSGEWTDRRAYYHHYPYIVELPAPNQGGGDPELTVTQVEGPVSGSDFNVGTTVVTYQVTDVCGNLEICNFEVEVLQTDAELTVNCVNDISVNTAPGASSAVVSWTAPTGTTNCFSDPNVVVTQTSGPASGDDISAGTYVVTYELTDACGTAETCSFNVEVVAVPSEITFTCPTDIVADALPGATSTFITFPILDGSSNCHEGSSVDITRTPSGNDFNVGTTTVTYTVTDDCGTTITCAFNVIVNEVPSEITVDNCLEDATIILQPGQLGQSLEDYLPTGTSTCFQNNQVTVTQTSGSTNGYVTSGINEFAFELTDACGVTTTCNYTITVNVAELNLSFECPDDQTIQLNTGETSTVVTYDDPIVVTNCALTPIGSFYTVTSGVPSGGTLEAGTHTIELETVNYCGATATCSFEVTVLPPAIVDNDNDGVPADQDCDDNNPIVPAVSGTPCDDGNPLTVNDTYQDDGCSCQGYESAVGCAYATYGEGTITINDLRAGAKAYIRSAAGDVVFQCGYSDTCPDGDVNLTVAPGSYDFYYYDYNPNRDVVCVSNLGPDNSFTVPATCVPGERCSFGLYFAFFDNDCNCVPTDADNDGVIFPYDCDDNNPNEVTYTSFEGVPCNDGDPNTANDRVQADGCTCMGTPIAACDDVDGDDACADVDCDDNDPAVGAPFVLKRCITDDGKEGVLFGSCFCQEINFFPTPPVTNAIAGNDQTAADSNQASARSEDINQLTGTNFKVYPNPTSDILSVALGDYAGQGAVIEVYSMVGQLVNQTKIETLADPVVQLNLVDLHTGVYTLSVQLSNGEVLTKRFVKQ